MNKSDLLDKIKTLLIRMRDHETPNDITSKEELGPLLRDAEELIETVSVLKYLIEEENQKVEAQTPETESVLSAIEEQAIDDPLEIEEKSVRDEEVMEEKKEAVAEGEGLGEQQSATIKDIDEQSTPGSQSTINEVIAPYQEKARVADTLERKGVDDLSSVIGINERYLFINELFDGDGDAFQIAINQLNSFDHIQEAMKYLRAEISDRYNWDQEQESTISFYALIEKRYAE